jgi:hypothetical protein
MRIKLQQGSFVGLWLLVLWCLSPLGGQASLRVLQRNTLTNRTAVPLHYMSTGPASVIFASGTARVLNTRFLTSIFPSREVMARHEDINGNLKIPRFEALNSTEGDGGWKEVPFVLAPEDFSALDGLRIEGLPRDQEAHFTVESSYVTASCQRLIQLPYSLLRTKDEIHKLSRAIDFDLTSVASRYQMPADPVNYNDKRTFFLSTDDQSTHMRLRAYLGLESQSPRESNRQTAPSRRLVFGSLYVVEGRVLRPVGA